MLHNSEQIYRSLQQHLNKQAVGFPATESGVEIKILQELFTPEQAKVALHLTYQPRTAADIFAQIKNSTLTLENVKNMLDEMEQNGAIMSMLKDGQEYYYTIPLLVGIVELHESKATPSFWENFGEYIKGEFGKAFANTKASQLRTIPIEQSISQENHVATYDQIREIINKTEGPIAIGKCICREHAKKRGQACKVTTRTDTCMAFGDWARHSIKRGIFRELTREEALAITEQNEIDGLVLQPSNYQKIDFVCACCGCCCGILQNLKHQPKPTANWAHNFYAVVTNDNCIGCGLCIDKCQMNAITVDGCATINLDRCIGCGLCVTACPTKAMLLAKKDKETVPPKDSISLYEILA